MHCSAQTWGGREKKTLRFQVKTAVCCKLESMFKLRLKEQQPSTHTTGQDQDPDGSKMQCILHCLDALMMPEAFMSTYFC